MPQSATPANLGGGVHPDAMQRENAAAAMSAAPIKGIGDLPPDHPMARRQALLDEITDINLKNEGVDATQYQVVDEDGDAGDTKQLEAVDLKSPSISDFTDPPAGTKPVAKVEAAKSDDAKQLAAQSGKEVLLDLDTLANAFVMVKIDGVEERVPASKALGQYQKGAAADVRLANATKILNDAKEASAKTLREAQEKVAFAPPSEKKDAVTQAQSAQAANEKFKKASEALFAGDPDEAARFFSEAVAATQAPASTVDAKAIDQDALVQQVSAKVEQQLTTRSALDKLFQDYPEIKAKKAFGLIADEYVEAYVSQGMTTADAIAAAGEAIGEEYSLGKFKPSATVPSTGRPLKTSGPTTIAAKLDAKKDLDEISSGHARSTSTVQADPTTQDVIAEMAARRPGAQVI